MKNTGAYLKQARESKGLSLHEVGMSLKVNPKVLKSIEEGDEKSLPAKTFLRGFVQSYAAHLKLDTKTVLDMFYNEVGHTKPAPTINPNLVSENGDSPSHANVTSITPQVSNERPIEASAISVDEALGPINLSSTKKYLATAGALVLIVLIVATKKLVDRYGHEAAGVEVSATTAPQAKIETQSTSGDTSSATTASAAANNASTSAPSTSVNAPATTAPPTSANNAATSTTNASSQAPTATPATIQPTLTASPTPNNPVANPAKDTAKPENAQSADAQTEKKTVEVIVEALDKVSIDYTSADGKKQNISLAPEQMHTFKSKGNLTLNVSDGGAVNVIVNGKDKGVPGELGKPVKLKY